MSDWWQTRSAQMFSKDMHRIVKALESIAASLDLLLAKLEERE